MPVAVNPCDLHRILCEPPTLGRLLDLGEENYRQLLKLVPGLPSLGAGRCSGLGEGVVLHLEVLGQTPYSSLVRLTHHFDHQGRRESEPGALLRVYHDARQVEVVGLGGWSVPVHRGGVRLATKWRLSLFLSKWLAYLLSQGQGFAPTQAQVPLTEGPQGRPEAIEPSP